ncbi:uncharacterized protein TM35_000451740 [Trypanosoma theileri]|uniref:Mucin TcMUCII n=1 Tax=Trypanosoma theileri TaxID=67003 RepID=A0A1X0NIC1_9TRYP|nr:uncharacterized protein TM35_000451740 [Trypanosoma theileri]ORC84436.1 hypothetical protein TM35_000451740 [Trypanosoma theileri]
MSVRHVFCVLTIALSCVCSCVVADDGAQALKAEKRGSEGVPAHVNEVPGASPCQPGSTIGKDGTSPCLESGGRGRNDDRVKPPDPQENKPGQVTKNTMDGLREEGSVSSGTKDELTEREKVEERIEEVDGRHVTKPGDDPAISGSPTDTESLGDAAVDTHSPSRTPAPGGKVQTENKEEEALGPEGQNVDASPAGGRGKGSQTAEERKEENLEDPPQGERTENARRTTTSSTTEVGTTVTEDNNGNQQAEGNGVPSTSPASPPPTEGVATRDTANTPNNNKESTSTTTTTTTTTTPTLPPELTNNKKGDADSSSSIISSVWVRVPLLIVVTLACILVC